MSVHGTRATSPWSAFAAYQLGSSGFQPSGRLPLSRVGEQERLGVTTAFLYHPGMGYLVGVGPGNEGALDAARSGGIIEGALVTAPDVPLASGICHAVESPNTDHGLCGQPVAKVLDQSFAAFSGLEHCVTCDAALSEAGSD